MNATKYSYRLEADARRPLPARRPVPARHPRGARGMGVVELLIALAISATVLAAVAYAVDMTFRAYSINHEQSDLMQRARLAMYRITTGIRTTGEHQPVNTVPLSEFKNGQVTTDTAIVMNDANGKPMGFKYDPAEKRLLAIDAAGAQYTLLRGVEKFEIKFEPLQSQEAKRTGGLVYDKLLRATILLTIRTTGNSADVNEKVGSQTITLSTSVIPRRNVW
jgi:Tfp pilus assembly protein PilW